MVVVRKNLLTNCCKLFSVRSQKMNYLSITILICQLSAENTNLNSESEKKKLEVMFENIYDMYH